MKLQLSPRAIKGDIRAWKWLVRDSGTQVLSPVLPAVGSDITQSIEYMAWWLMSLPEFQVF